MERTADDGDLDREDEEADDDEDDDDERVRLDDFFFLCVDDFGRCGDAETDLRLSLDFFDEDLECVVGGAGAEGGGGGGAGGAGAGERLREEIETVGERAFGFGFSRLDSTGDSCLRRYDLRLP